MITYNKQFTIKLESNTVDIVKRLTSVLNKDQSKIVRKALEIGLLVLQNDSNCVINA